MRYSSKFLGWGFCPHATKLLTKPFCVRRRARTRQTAPARTLMMKNRFVFGWADRTRTDSYHTPPTRNNSTTKQALGEAARVRRDADRAERFHEFFALGQRVKLRRAEAVDAFL